MKLWSKLMGANLLVSVCMCSVFAQSDENPIAALDWKKGPTTVRIAGVAKQDVGNGYLFLEADDAKKFMELSQNPDSNVDGVILYAQDNASWFAFYSYDGIGYVKDDEKGSLDSDAILESIRAGTEQANVERRRRGWSEMKVLGWARKPHYDESTHNLEWAIKGASDEGTVVNYNTRFLGRGGVMSVTLVCSTDQLSSVLPEFKSALQGFSYTSGNRYFEYRKGDRTAEVGLSALILGGAAAAAAKTGAFKWLWKGIVVVALAIGGFLKKIFGGKKDQ